MSGSFTAHAVNLQGEAAYNAKTMVAQFKALVGAHMGALAEKPEFESRYTANQALSEAIARFELNGGSPRSNGAQVNQGLNDLLAWEKEHQICKTNGLAAQLETAMNKAKTMGLFESEPTRAVAPQR